MEWIDDQLASPIRVPELMRMYDRLIQALISTAQEFDPIVVATYSNLWLTCLLLERVRNPSLSKTQLERVTETKKRCLLILQVSDLYTDTPLDLLAPEGIAIERVEHGMISWNFRRTISFDKSTLLREESMLTEMANTPLPDKPTELVLYRQWYQLRDRVIETWGEEEYQKLLESSTRI